MRQLHRSITCYEVGVKCQWLSKIRSSRWSWIIKLDPPGDYDLQFHSPVWSPYLSKIHLRTHIKKWLRTPSSQGQKIPKINILGEVSYWLRIKQVWFHHETMSHGTGYPQQVKYPSLVFYWFIVICTDIELRYSFHMVLREIMPYTNTSCRAKQKIGKMQNIV